jgi:hypothetical protein
VTSNTSGVRDVFLPLPRRDKVVNVAMFCHPCSLLFEFQLLLLLEPLQPSHLLRGAGCLQESFLSDGLQIQLIPPYFYNIPLLVRERLGYVLDCIVVLPAFVAESSPVSATFACSGSSHSQHTTVLPWLFSKIVRLTPYY